ncbi:MAG: SDR family oxidoreductase [Clostridiales bacterium]|nr:SDR family oxidoreductase [Clostridiales bacterium]
MTSPVSYTYDKWGLVGLTKYIANYYGKYNIRCNCISPGGFLESQPQEFIDNYNRMTPLGRMACGDDIKGAIAFLASEAPNYITGHNLAVDGGWTSW